MSTVVIPPLAPSERLSPWGPAPRQRARADRGKSRRSVSLDEALSIVLGSVSALGEESIHILEADNRILHEDIVSDVMIPPRACSARDGYALRASDTEGASASTPLRLKIIGEVRAGGSCEGLRVAPGTAVRIMTGAPMPAGADAVAQFEDAQEDACFVNIFRQARRHENYRHAGENIKRHERVLQRGDRLGPADVGILASLNRALVKVYRQPTVAIVSTGDELAGLGEESGFGKVRDVNAYALYAEAKRYNALPQYLGIARDTPQDLKESFAKALHADVIISTGGGSMGKYDFVREVYADLGIRLRFERVNVKPGKPCSFGTKDGKLFFSLPGNPVSALTSFIQFVRPAILRLMGAKRIAKPVVEAILQEDIVKRQTRNLRLLRGRFFTKDNQLHVSTMGHQKPSVFQTMRDANCLIMIPENVAKVQAGQRVAIQLIYHDEV